MQDELETMPLPADQDNWFAEADATDDTADDAANDHDDELADDAEEMTDDEADADEVLAAGEENEGASDA